jgi:hypothetical protein
LISISDCCLTPNEQFATISSYIQWNNNDVRFLLSQHAYLDFYNASSLKSVGRHFFLLGHIIQIPSQQVFVLSTLCCVCIWEATNSNHIWRDRGSSSISTPHEAITITIKQKIMLLISISYKQREKLMIFVGDQNILVIDLLRLNSDYKIVIIWNLIKIVLI